MSTVLSYRTSMFNILICDTRLVKHTNNKRTYSDNQLKMHYAHEHGFFAGMGVGELLINTFNLFISHHQSNNNILQAFRTSYDSIKDECDEEVLSLLNKSSVIVSTRTSIEFFSKCFISCLGKDAISLKKHELNLQFPFDIQDNTKKGLIQRATLVKTDEIDSALIQMLDIFGIISKLSEDVSEISSVAILRANNKAPFYFQDRSSELIKQLQQNSFSGMENQYELYKRQLTTES